VIPRVGFAVAGVLLLTLSPAAQSVSLQRDALNDWTSLKSTMMKISEVMPAGKYGYRSTPPQRSFGEQILHVAEANVIQMGRLGSRAAAPPINMKATSKAEILEALSDSFDYGTAVLREQNDETMLKMADPSRFSFGGPSTRARVVFFVIGHTWDIYGQMAVYLRLNGLVPPASQRP
jgi:uncharacterized damage-inducible protein DinB